MTTHNTKDELTNLRAALLKMPVRRGMNELGGILSAQEIDELEAIVAQEVLRGLESLYSQRYIVYPAPGASRMVVTANEIKKHIIELRALTRTPPQKGQK